MGRILVINPNASQGCTAAIEAAVAPLRPAAGPEIVVVGLAEGPPAILSWQDWHQAAAPICAAVRRATADAYLIACASDPGIEAARAVTERPVLGVFRCAVAAALTRAERFGVIAIVEASRGRHLAALRAMGVESRLAAEVALNVTMESLLDPTAARERLIGAATACAEAGAEAVVLGCTGMAAHRALIERAVGLPVIEPCQAGVQMAVLAVGGAG